MSFYGQQSRYIRFEICFNQTGIVLNEKIKLLFDWHENLENEPKAVIVLSNQNWYITSDVKTKKKDRTYLNHEVRATSAICILSRYHNIIVYNGYHEKKYLLNARSKVGLLASDKEHTDIVVQNVFVEEEPHALPTELTGQPGNVEKFIRIK